MGTEKLIAIKVCNFYWVVSHKKNSADFYVYKITENGPASPIIQTIGTSLTSGWNGVGVMKFSPDGQILACTIGPYSNQSGGGIDLFDFDLQSGTLSNHQSIPNIDKVYGLEFSPSGNYLYASREYAHPSNVVQFNLNAGDIQAIGNSKFEVFSDSNFQFGSLQLAPDNKIYVAKEIFYDTPVSFLDVISQPNSPNVACNYISNHVNLSPNQSQIGLPTFVGNFFLPPTEAYISQTLCTGQTIDINGTTFSESNPNGAVTLPNAAQGGCDSIVNVQLLFLPAIQENFSQTLCAGQTIDINGTTFSESNPNGSVILPNAAQSGCDSIVNVSLSFSQTIIGHYQANSCKGDTVFVNGGSFQYNNPSGSVLMTGAAQGGCDSLVNIDLQFYDDTSRIQQTLCIADTLVVADSTFSFFHPSGIISLANAAYSGCDSIIQVNLDFHGVDTTYIQDTICWYDSVWVNNQLYYFEKMEGFEVIPTENCDSLVAIQLYSPYDQIPILDILAKDSICYGEIVTLHASSTLQQPNFSWYQNGSSICESCETALTPIIRDDRITLYAVDPIGCKLVTDRDFDVLMDYGVYIPNVFSPNGDGINDKFTLYANKKGEELVLFQIYDRWGNLVYQTAHKDIHAFKKGGWDGKYRDKIMDTGVYIYLALVKFIDGETREFSGDVTLVR